MAAQEFGCFNPLVMIFHGLFAPGFVGVTQSALIVAHHQQASDPFPVGAPFEFGEISLVLGLVHPELIDVFDRINAVVAFGSDGEIQVVELLGGEGAVQRPLRQRDFEKTLPGDAAGSIAHTGSQSESCSRQTRLSDEETAIEVVLHCVIVWPQFNEPPRLHPPFWVLSSRADERKPGTKMRRTKQNSSARGTTRENS